jgi:hypothetical protein
MLTAPKRFYWLTELLRPFNCQIFLYDPYCMTEQAHPLGTTKMDSLDELFSRCRVVSCNAPLAYAADDARASTSRFQAMAGTCSGSRRKWNPSMYLDAVVEKKLTAAWGPRASWPIPEDDIIRILWPVEDHDISESGFRDRFDCEWKK